MHHQFHGTTFCHADCPLQQFRQFFRKGHLKSTNNLLIFKGRG